MYVVVGSAAETDREVRFQPVVLRTNTLSERPPQVCYMRKRRQVRENLPVAGYFGLERQDRSILRGRRGLLLRGD